MKRIIKKIIKIILILMLIISLMTACTYKAYAASAAGVVVAGGSIGTGGAAAGLLGLMGPVTAILGIALASYGIYAVLDSSAEEEGMTKTEFIYDKFNEYNEQRNLSNQAMQDLILDGASVLKNGAISISNAASAYIKGFITYMFGTEQIVSPDAITGTSTATFAGIQLPLFSKGEHLYLSPQVPDFYFYNDPEGSLYAGYRVGNNISFLTNRYQRYNYSSLGMWSLYSIKSNIWHLTGFSRNDCPFPNVLDYYNSEVEFWNAITEEFPLTPEPPASISSSLVGDEAIYNDRSGTLSPSAGENTVFTPPLVDGLSGTGTISIPDYLDAINDLLNDSATDIPIADPVTDVVTSVAVTDVDLTDTVPSVDTDEEQDEVGTTAVVDPDAPLKPDVDTINSLAFDLREIFPFCIPFDLYNLLSKFIAEPEAPHWQISIPLPLNLPALEFEIDLSAFESVGVVLRSFEMVLFVASLAVATRSIYLRG